MDIVFIVPTLDYGGVETRIYQIASYLRTCSINLTIINIGPAGHIGGKLQEDGFSVFNLNLKPKIASFFTTIKLFQLMRKLKFDLVHTFIAEANWHGSLANVFLSKPLIIDEVGVPVQRTKIGNIVLRQVYKRADRILVRSRRLRKWLIDKCYARKEKIEVLPYFMDNSKFMKLPDKELMDYRKKCIIITSIGRLSKEKGQELILYSLPFILKKYANVKLRLVGDGSNRQSLEKIAEGLGISKKVEFMGFREDTESILRDTDIFILSSYTEDVSLALLEAMAAGCVCISTLVGGNNSAITSNESGILIPGRDICLLAQTVCGLIANPKKALEISKKARIYAGMQDFGEYIDKLTRIYETAINSSL